MIQNDCCFKTKYFLKSLTKCADKTDSIDFLVPSVPIAHHS